MIRRVGVDKSAWFNIFNLITQTKGNEQIYGTQEGEKTQLECVTNTDEERNYTKQPREVGNIDRQSNELQAG